MFLSKSQISGFGLLLFFFSFAFGQEIQLNPVVVSATFNEQHLSEALSSVSSISRQQIEQSQAASLADLLQGEAGFEFGRNGGLGSTTSLFLRGQDSKNLAVYIDGVRTQVDQIGALQITDIPLAQIERIEILRGNASALYGDSAVGGVIQIFTRQGSGSPRPYGSLSMGGYGFREINTGYGGEIENFRFNFQAGNTVSTGFSTMNTSQKTSANPDADSYMAQFFNMNLEKKVATDTAVGVRTNHRYYDNQYDMNSGASSDIHYQTKTSDLYVVYLQTKFTQDWKSKLDVSNSKLSYEQFLNGSRNTRDYGYGLNVGQQKGVRWFNQFALDEKNTMNFGLDYSEDDAAFTGTNLDSYSTKRFARGYFIGTTHTKEPWSFQANIRKDVMDISNTDVNSVLTSVSPNTVSGLLGLGYEFDTNWKLITSISNGFSAPTAYDISQNTQLTPETFLSKEVGLTHLTSNQMLRVVYFEMTTQNSVLYDDITGLPYNTQSTENKGIETSFQTQWQSYRIKSSLVLQNPRSITYNESLARRAKQYASVDISEHFEKYDLGATMYATGERKDKNNDYKTVDLNSYGLFSVYIAAPLDKDWTFRMKIDNVFDKDYQLAYGYNTPGRTLTATLSYQPK